MVLMKFTESVVEESSINCFKGLGYHYLPGSDIACDASTLERGRYAYVILSDRLQVALFVLNLGIPAEALDDDFKKVTRSESPSLIFNSRHFHNMFANGLTSGCC